MVMERVVNVIKPAAPRPADAIDIALLVGSSSKQEIDTWDRSKIVDSLVKEAGTDPALAAEIAEAVEDRIDRSNLMTVTTAIIREMVDLELLERGLTAMHKRHSHLGLPMWDVEQIISNANKENSNTTHNPESINLTIAETILKEFALRRVFSEDVAEAHYVGDMHLHDLGFIIRPYTYMGDTVVETEDGRLISLEDLYEQYPLETNPENGTWVKYPQSGLRIRDKDGFVRVLRFVKRERRGKKMYFAKTEDGKSCVVTHDHPMLVHDGRGGYEMRPVAELKAGDMLSTFDAPRREDVKRVNLLQLLADAGRLTGYSVKLDDRSQLDAQVAHAYLMQGKLGERDLETATITCVKHSKHDLPVLMPLTEDLGWVIGFIIGDGHSDGASIGVTQNEGPAFDRLKQNLRRLGLDTEERDHDGSRRLMLNSRVWSDIIFDGMGIGRSARTKGLPPFFPNTNGFRKGLLAGLVDSDGSIDTTGVSIRVASAKLTWQTYELARSLGFRPTLQKPQGLGSERVHKGRLIKQRYPVFGVRFSKLADIDLPSGRYADVKPATKCLTPAASLCSRVVAVEEVQIPDKFIYDVTTESGTLMANGIYSKNCGGHSLEYIKKFGLNLPNITSVSKPAQHAEVLIGHMVKMASALQAHYAGAVGWEAVNIFFAPYLTGKSFEEIRQLAQMLIFEFNQLAGARGSQVVFTDFNLYYNVPRHFADTPAIGPGGLYTGKTYGDYAAEAQAFLRAMFEVYADGDATGKTFVFPKPLLHINEDFFSTPGHEEFLEQACAVASKQGITYFVFDRGDEVTVSQCCRLKLKLSASQLDETKTPEVMRFSALQNVTINLPRIAYKARGNDSALFMELNRAIELVAKAHVQKRAFIQELVDLGKEGPLGLLTQNLDGKPYLKMDELTYLAGLIGLNELVEVHTGQQLHESDEALRFGLKVISAMNLKCRELSERYGMNMVLEESPAESAGYRLAKLDMKYWPAQAAAVVKGDLASQNYYYTNSIHLAVDAPIDYVERVQKQSRFHPLIDAGAIVHVWLGESEPDPSAIRSFVVKTFRNTACSQIAFSPEFTVCEACHRTSRGLKSQCPLCGSMDVYGVTRIVGYFSKVQTWNRSKLGELYDRVRTDLTAESPV